MTKMAKVKSEKPLTIGRVARQAGVNVETIRYYQKRGLIQEPSKPVFGYRCYPTDTVSRIHFIKRAQSLGFTLEEIANLLKLGDGHCAETQKIARQKVALIESCESQNTPPCPIISALTEKNSEASSDRVGMKS